MVAKRGECLHFDTHTVFIATNKYIVRGRRGKKEQLREVWKIDYEHLIVHKFYAPIGIEKQALMIYPLNMHKELRDIKSELEYIITTI